MSIDEISRFRADLTADAALHELFATCGADPAKVVALANAKGYGFTVDELVEHVKQRKAELDEKQLDKVAGGVGTNPDSPMEINVAV